MHTIYKLVVRKHKFRLTFADYFGEEIHIIIIYNNNNFI